MLSADINYNYKTADPCCYLCNLSQCIDTMSTLESCGGCPEYYDGEGSGRTKKAGMDCTTLPFVDEVYCRSGRCKIGEWEFCKTLINIAETRIKTIGVILHAFSIQLAACQAHDCQMTVPAVLCDKLLGPFFNYDS